MVRLHAVITADKPTHSSSLCFFFVFSLFVLLNRQFRLSGSDLFLELIALGNVCSFDYDRNDTIISIWITRQEMALTDTAIIPSQ